MPTEVNHATSTRNTMATTVIGLLNGGTVEIQTSANAVLCVLTIPNPAISGTATNGVATVGAIATANATAAGTAAKYVAKASGGATVFDGTVGIAGSGEGMIIDNTSLAIGQPIRINSWTYTASL